MATTKNNRERHEVVQDFMLANDTATLACEVPVYLYSDEAAEFGFLKNSGVDSGEGVTGHIDLIQIRFGYIHLLDFKPMAAKEKHAMAQGVLGCRVLEVWCWWGVVVVRLWCWSWWLRF